MADNEYVNKVETADGTVLMDITDSTVESGTMLRGVVAYGATGERLVGTLGNATQSSDGLMSAADKTKLNGIASGATANTVENVLTSTSTTNALSAAQGKALNDSKAPIASPNFQGSISVDSTKVPVSNPEHGIGFGTCATAAATNVKAVTLSGFALRNGAVCAVRFTYAVLAGAKLNVNSTGSKDIYYHGSAITANKIKAGDLGVFMYNNTNYHLIAVDSAATHQLKWGDLYST